MPEKQYVIDELISAKAIAARVEELAREITGYYKGTDKLVVDFFVDFEFKSALLQRIIGVVFGEAMHRIVRAFEARAAVLYGRPSN